MRKLEERTNKDSHEVFAEVNARLWKPLKKGDGKVLININGIPQQTVMAGIAARLLNRKFGFEPVGLISGCTKKRDDVRKVLGSFGVMRFLRLSRNPWTRPLVLIKAIRHAARGWCEVQKGGFERFIANFQVNGIHLGDLIYDSFIRYDHTYLDPKAADAKFKRVLRSALWSFFASEDIFMKKDVRYVIMSESVYAISQAILMRIAAKRKGKALFVNAFGFAKIYAQYEDTFEDRFKITEETLETSRSHEKRIMVTEAYLERRRSGQLSHHDVINAYRDKKVWNRETLASEFGIEDDGKKFIFIMPHCFSDANHKTRHVLYRDFYQWFEETLAIIAEVDSVHWFVKPHPSGFHYREEGQVEEMVSNMHRKNVFLTPADCSTDSVLGIADGVVTVNGNIGLEAACTGIRPLLAGKAIYSGHGFAEMPESKEAYRSSLQEMATWTRLDEDTVHLAKEIMYCNQFYTRPCSTIIPVGSVRPGCSNEEFQKFYQSTYDSMTEKLRHTPLEEDPYYQSLEELVERGRDAIRSSPVTVEAIY